MADNSQDQLTLEKLVKGSAMGDSPAVIDLIKNTPVEKLVSLEHGQSPLTYAIQNMNINGTANAILEKANSTQLFATDKNGKTYLDVAIESGNLEVASKIVKKASAEDLEQWSNNPKRAILEQQIRKSPDNDFSDSAHGALVDFTNLEAKINKKLGTQHTNTDTKIGNGSTQWTPPEHKGPAKEAYLN